MSNNQNEDYVYDESKDLRKRSRQKYGNLKQPLMPTPPPQQIFQQQPPNCQQTGVRLTNGLFQAMQQMSSAANLDDIHRDVEEETKREQMEEKRAIDEMNRDLQMNKSVDKKLIEKTVSKLI